MNTKRTTYFLMANLGSELIRFFNLQKQNNDEHARASATRAFHIIDQLMKQQDIGNGKQEIAILRTLVEDALSNTKMYTVHESDLHNYFAPFASKILTI